jgi:hypothetical protein
MTTTSTPFRPDAGFRLDRTQEAKVRSRPTR